VAATGTHTHAHTLRTTGQVHTTGQTQAAGQSRQQDNCGSCRDNVVMTTRHGIRTGTCGEVWHLDMIELDNWTHEQWMVKMA